MISSVGTHDEVSVPDYSLGHLKCETVRRSFLVVDYTISFEMFNYLFSESI